MPLEMTITTTGFPEAEKRLRAINRQRIVRGAKFFIRRRLQEGLETIKEEAPIGPTGELKEKISLDINESEDDVVATYKSGAPYSEWVHGGTGEFGQTGAAIVSLSGKNLVFFWEKENRWVRTKAVRGQPANPFLRRGVETIKKRLVTTLPKEIRQDIQSIIGGG